MIRLLMLDLDSLLVAVIARALHHEGVAVEGVRSVDLARARVEAGGADVALLDANLLDAADFALLRQVPVVLTTSFGTAEDASERFGGARLLLKPFTGGQLLTALREALGPLQTESVLLVDLLLRAHTEGSNTGFSVGHAELFIEEGELVHVRRGTVEGEAALAAILADSQHVPQRIPARAVNRNIARPFRTVLLDALSVVDMREQVGFLRQQVPTQPWRRGGPRS